MFSIYYTYTQLVNWTLSEINNLLKNITIKKIGDF